MEVEGPDSLRSWIVALACLLIYMLQYGVNRLSGILFVASMPRYNVGREAASFPYTFNNVIMSISGPIVGCLGQKFGVRPVAIFGCVLCASGVGACYLAQDIAALTVLWGLFFGIGLACSISLLPVVINQHFEKKRATASGVSFSGVSLGSFILPPIVHILIDNYGISVTFIFLCGLLLCCIPASLLLRHQAFDSKKPLQSSSEETQRLVSDESRFYSEVKSYYPEAPYVHNAVDSLDKAQNSEWKYKTFPKRKYNESKNFQNTQESFLITQEDQEKKSDHPFCQFKSNRCISQNAVFQDRSDHDLKEQCCSHCTPSDFQNSNNQTSVHFHICEKSNTHESNHLLNKSYEKPSFKYSTEVIETSNSKLEPSTNPQKYSEVMRYNSRQHVENCNIEKDPSLSCSHTETGDIYTECVIRADNENIKENISHQFQNGADVKEHLVFHTNGKNHCKSQIRNDFKRKPPLFPSICDPVFITIVITVSLYMFLMVCLITVIVDFAIDIGVENKHQKYVIMSISAGELVGRLSLGWVTDGRYMTRTGFMAFSFLTQGLAVLGIGFSNGFSMLIFMLALHGLLHSGVPQIYGLIVADFIEEDQQIFTISSSAFLAGPLSLCVSPLIGYFRDELGSYTYIFYGMSIISILCGILWLLIPSFIKHRRQPSRQK